MLLSLQGNVIVIVQLFTVNCVYVFVYVLAYMSLFRLSFFKTAPIK